MKVLLINSTVYSSTGAICRELAEEMERSGIDNLFVYTTGETSNGRINLKRVGNMSYLKRQAIRSRLLGNYGFNSKGITKKLIKTIEEYDPDIVHLHNMHTHNCNLTMLFDFLKNRRQKLVWTFHDCWAFTAYCTHFTISGCDKWKTHCESCPQYKEYSALFDRSAALYDKKRALFEGLDLTVVTPSDWLNRLVGQSMFSGCPVKTIHNGIDTDVFRPEPSDFREQNGISADQKLILGVAFDWGYKKGLDVFAELSKRLDKDKYRIALVGAGKAGEKTPENIIVVPRTDSRKKLAQIYTAADVFVNPTREEVLGLVNIEANACGTPVVTFDTGGSPECIDEKSGSTVPCDDIDALLKGIEDICYGGKIKPEDCVKRASGFGKRKTYSEYIKLYEEIYDRTTKA